MLIDPRLYTKATAEARTNAMGNRRIVCVQVIPPTLGAYELGPRGVRERESIKSPIDPFAKY